MVRWHTCIAALGEPKSADDEKRMKFAYRHGWAAHTAIQGAYARIDAGIYAEKPELYAEEGLPFDIGYHPDLYDPKANVVREIKPQEWFLKHVDYCVAQLSGYCHFKQATGIFVLYHGSGPLLSWGEARMPRVIPWDKLREIALTAFKAGRPHAET